MKRSRSVLKNIRKNAKRRKANTIHKKQLKAAIKKLTKLKTKQAAAKEYKKVQSLIDKTVQDGIIRKNKAARYKSGLIKRINKKH
ncbi:hypothetical protein A2Y85_05595 [candidate division WOR-3 bacterium RBG_13_43_14]|uniref:Small ribosomal subunit protein bS20 n=1 Tax=candidate division WOR-3 bacterium RBG_13_43_14 TaxID=1802590 RepID=A0A1F4UF82_UNCW3|nr:MAG: hypothetical protein A2Y85_05595 [candidate division WOR-3 bacterium RBG_13_43_14]